MTGRTPLLPSGLLRGTGSLCGPASVSSTPSRHRKEKHSHRFCKGPGCQGLGPSGDFFCHLEQKPLSLFSGVRSTLVCSVRVFLLLVRWDGLFHFKSLTGLKRNLGDLGTFPGVSCAQGHDPGQQVAWRGKTASELCLGMSLLEGAVSGSEMWVTGGL